MRIVRSSNLDRKNPTNSDCVTCSRFIVNECYNPVFLKPSPCYDSELSLSPAQVATADWSFRCLGCS